MPGETPINSVTPVVTENPEVPETGETSVAPVEGEDPKVPVTEEPTVTPITPEIPVVPPVIETPVAPVITAKPISPMAPRMTREAAEIENLEYRFKDHEPKEGQYTDLRHLGLFFTQSLLKIAPDSRERALAITKAEEAIMWAQAALDRN